MSETTDQKKSHRRVAVPAVIAGGIGSLLLAFSMTPTFSALSAAIQNSTDTAGTGALIMQEANSTGTILCNSTDGGSISTNSATCATINKYGGNLAMVPGQTVTTAITIKDTGTVAATAFTLTPGACTQSNNGTANGTATDLCTKINIVITSGSTTVFTGTAAALTSGGAINVLAKLGTSSVASGASVPFSFAVTLDSSVGNTYQGLQISQPLTWNFGA
jgi:hypothetical protein